MRSIANLANGYLRKSGRSQISKTIHTGSSLKHGGADRMISMECEVDIIELLESNKLRASEQANSGTIELLSLQRLTDFGRN